VARRIVVSCRIKQHLAAKCRSVGISRSQRHDCGEGPPGAVASNSDPFRVAAECFGVLTRPQQCAEAVFDRSGKFALRGEAVSDGKYGTPGSDADPSCHIVVGIEITHDESTSVIEHDETERSSTRAPIRRIETAGQVICHDVCRLAALTLASRQQHAPNLFSRFRDR
jgi:hypothetical protein